jgi:anti-anti-sigma factor
MADYQMVDVTVQPSSVVVLIKEPFLSTTIAAEILESELRQIIAEHHPAVLVLDFRHVKMISSSSIGKLLLIQKHLRSQAGQLHLCCVSVPIAEAYRALGLSEQWLMVFETVEDALHTRVVGMNEDREIMED